MKLNKSFIDMLIRIKNSYMNYKQYCEIIKTKKNIKFLKFLINEGYLFNYSLIDTNKNKISVKLKYENNEPMIKKINFISKCNKEVYCSTKILSKIRDIDSSYIMLTNKGYMTMPNAKLKNIGGQIICKFN